MTVDTKVVGGVYGIIVKYAEEYFTRYPRLWGYDGLRRKLLTHMRDEYSKGSEYPVDFFTAMADIALEWCEMGFADMTKDDIKPFYQSMWKFHKAMLVGILCRQYTLNNAVDEAQRGLAEFERTAKLDPAIYKMAKRTYGAILRHLEGVANSMESLSGDQPDSDTNPIDGHGAKESNNES